MSGVLLLSGGMDSTALGYWLRPDAALFIDYGQPAAAAERRSAQRVMRDLGLPWAELAIDCSVLASVPRLQASLGKPASETWWPFRNQLLATFASAWAILNGATEVIIGTVAGDGNVHRDGTPWFVDTLDTLLAGQEGGMRVRAPAIELTTEVLAIRANLSIATLATTYSCHRGPLPCGECGGCWKRDEVIRALSEG